MLSRMESTKFERDRRLVRKMQNSGENICAFNYCTITQKISTFYFLKMYSVLTSSVCYNVKGFRESFS
jgi:hypothetical protein